MKRLLTTILAGACVGLTAGAQQPQPCYSYLEIYDIPTRTHKIIKTFPFLIEAPNWTPDGKWLVINKGGRLYKLAPDGSTDLIEIPTGAITQCNNDHVITADGRWIGLSSNDPSNKRSYNSYIYVVPFEGGGPRRITPVGPSYLHGISPDGKMAAYCAFRGPNNEQDVYAMPLDGGEEIRLTNAPGLDDGPEYSPDGRQIWFNSVRTGRMQVWTMKADGQNQTQMTFDEDMNSWFPHISPDGKTVVYIAYHAYEIDPGSHVANLNVQLRMIPASGGTPEVLTELFGGQGSLNVNSWSPDSRQFAYVSYRLMEETQAPRREMAMRLSDIKDLLCTPEGCAYALQRLSQMGYTAVDITGLENLVPQVQKAGLEVLASPSLKDGRAITVEGSSFIQYQQENSVLVILEHPASANLLQAFRKMALHLRNATE